jgi:ferrochelatase
MKSQKAILLLNTGTPEAPDTRNVRKFLSQFLNDKRVIDLPWLFRKILVNLIIVPFRAPSSSKRYKRLWTDKGSPLHYYGISLQEKLADKLGEDFIVRFAVNYGKPGIEETIAEVCSLKAERITVFPLFPQYASSTTGSVIEKCEKTLSAMKNIPEFTAITEYYSHPEYISALSSCVSEYGPSGFDHIVISYHGLPLRQVNKAHDGRSCAELNCTGALTKENSPCYQAMCFETSRRLAAKLNIEPENYTVCFQSRISKNWLSPFTDEIIISLAKEGKKNIMVICPSFTADCLETIIEVGEEYRDLFISNGGEKFLMVPALNDREIWVDAILKILSVSFD